jgi:hypothetical protein
MCGSLVVSRAKMSGDGMFELIGPKRSESNGSAELVYGGDMGLLTKGLLPKSVECHVLQLSPKKLIC